MIHYPTAEQAVLAGMVRVPGTQNLFASPRVPFLLFKITTAAKVTKETGRIAFEVTSAGSNTLTAGGQMWFVCGSHAVLGDLCIPGVKKMKARKLGKVGETSLGDRCNHQQVPHELYDQVAVSGHFMMFAVVTQADGYGYCADSAPTRSATCQVFPSRGSDAPYIRGADMPMTPIFAFAEVKLELLLGGRDPAGPITAPNAKTLCLTDVPEKMQSRVSDAFDAVIKLPLWFNRVETFKFQLFMQNFGFAPKSFDDVQLLSNLRMKLVKEGQYAGITLANYYEKDAIGYATITNANVPASVAGYEPFYRARNGTSGGFHFSAGSPLNPAGALPLFYEYGGISLDVLSSIGKIMVGNSGFGSDAIRAGFSPLWSRVGSKDQADIAIQDPTTRAIDMLTAGFKPTSQIISTELPEDPIAAYAAVQAAELAYGNLKPQEWVPVLASMSSTAELTHCFIETVFRVAKRGNAEVFTPDIIYPTPKGIMYENLRIFGDNTQLVYGSDNGPNEFSWVVSPDKRIAVTGTLFVRDPSTPRMVSDMMVVSSDGIIPTSKGVILDSAGVTPMADRGIRIKAASGVCFGRDELGSYMSNANGTGRQAIANTLLPLGVTSTLFYLFDSVSNGLKTCPVAQVISATPTLTASTQTPPATPVVLLGHNSYCLTGSVMRLDGTMSQTWTDVKIDSLAPLSAPHNPGE